MVARSPFDTKRICLKKPIAETAARKYLEVDSTHWIQSSKINGKLGIGASNFGG